LKHATVGDVTILPESEFHTLTTRLVKCWSSLTEAMY